VRKGVPFRDAHHAAGSAVAHAAKSNVDLAQLPLAELKRFSPAIEAMSRSTSRSNERARAQHLRRTSPSRSAAIARARSRNYFAGRWLVVSRRRAGFAPVIACARWRACGALDEARRRFNTPSF